MKTLIAAAALVVLTAPAFAQQTPSTPATPPSVDATTKVDAFATIDADKNGSLTLAEVKIQDVTVTQADFDKYDADKSKSLSKAEFDKWSADKKAGKQPG
jgi:hypothetical protein